MKEKEIMKVKEIVRKLVEATGVCHPVLWWLCIQKKLKYDRTTKTFVRDVLGSQMHLNGMDNGLSLYLARHGIREPESVELLKNYLTPDMNILDLGANIGFYVLIEGQVIQHGKGKIIALEPGPSNVKLLELNVSVNNYEDKVQIVSGAIANKSGTAELVMSELCNCHHLLEYASPDFNGYTETVKAYTIVDLLKNCGMTIDQLDLLRMDVEGAEYMILPSILESLRNHEKFLMFIEFHPTPKDEPQHIKLLKQLEEIGFICLGATKEYKKNFSLHRQSFPNATIQDLYSDPILLKGGGCEVFLGKGY